jgi:Transglycosylase SLT domain
LKPRMSTRTFELRSGSAIMASVWLVGGLLGLCIIADGWLESPNLLFASRMESFGVPRTMQNVEDIESGYIVTVPVPLRDTLAPPEPVLSTRTGRRMVPLEAQLERTHPFRDSSVAKLGQIRDSVVTMEAQRQGVPALLALAVSKVEDDRGIPWVVSPGGDVGVMQVNPRAHPGHSMKKLADPGINAQVGVGILRHYKQRYGSWERALRAYNGALTHKASGDAYVAAVRRAMTALGGDSTYASLTFQESTSGTVSSQQGQSTDRSREE